MSDKALPCIACGKELANLFESLNQPSSGTAFASGGHYGSTVFDPMDGTQLEINVCDECLTAAGTAKRVLHYHYGQREPEAWAPPASAIEARSDATGTGAAEGESAAPERGDAR